MSATSPSPQLPLPTPTPRGRVIGWITAHKVWTAVILLLVVGQVGAAMSQDPATSRAGEGPVVTTSPPPSEAAPTVEVPRLTGLPLSAARDRLQKVGLPATVEEQYSQKEPGVVIGQYPAPGGEVDEGTVFLTVPKGVPRVPDVVGLSRSTASSKLEKAGYKVGVKKVE